MSLDVALPGRSSARPSGADADLLDEGAVVRAARSDQCIPVPTHGDFPWERDERRLRGRRLFRAPRLTAGVRTAVVLCAVAAVAAGVVQFVGPGIGTSHGHPSGVYVAVPGPWRWRWVPVLHPAPGQPDRVRQRYRMVKYIGYGLPHRQRTLEKALVEVRGPWHWRWVRVPHPARGRPQYVRERYRSIKYVPPTEAPARTP
jgi:hypothetical protein